MYHPNRILEEQEGLRHFLGLSRKEFCHLFVPTLQSVDLGGEDLGTDATPEQVAENIRIFLEKELEKRNRKFLAPT